MFDCQSTSMTNRYKLNKLVENAQIIQPIFISIGQAHLKKYVQMGRQSMNTVQAKKKP